MVIPARRFRSNNITITDLEKNEESCDKCDSSTNTTNKTNQSFQTEQPLNNLNFRNKFEKKHLNQECVIFLISGIKLQGYFCGFDDEVIILKSLDKTSEQIVYQNTIATLQFKD